MIGSIGRFATNWKVTGFKRRDRIGPEEDHEIRASQEATEQLQSIIRKAEKRGELIAALFRLVIFIALISVDLGKGVSLPTNHPFVAVIIAYGLASGFGLYLAWRGVQFGALSYLLAGLDVVVLAASISMVERMIGVAHDPAMSLPMFSLIFVMLIHAAMRYKPGLIAYAAALFLVALPLFDWLTSRAMSADSMVTWNGGPSSFLVLPWSPFDLIHYRSAVIIFVILATIILFYITRRTRYLLRESIIQERKVERLSRFFPQNVVSQLAEFDSPIRTPRTQPIAVLFADVVGFTRMVETASSDEVISFLRDFHHVMEEAVFNSGGTLEKFMGDGIMATFGTPTVGHCDATNALNCAFGMFKALENWNTERCDKGKPPIRLSVGIHYGEALLGEIGSPRRLELAVVGDVVNVASRLEGLTRKLGCKMVISDSFVGAYRHEETQECHATLKHLRDAGQQALRGRGEQVRVWAWGDINHEPICAASSIQDGSSSHMKVS